MKDGVFKIYFSHHIRGPKGEKATKKDIEENIKKHVRIAEEIKSYLIDWEKMDGLPKCYLYVPAEHDEFVQIAFDKHYVGETEILDVDCEIINSCDLLIAYGEYKSSRGMKIEINHALHTEVPVYYMCDSSVSCIRGLKATIKLVMSLANGEEEVDEMD